MEKSTPVFTSVDLEVPGLEPTDELPLDIEIDDPRRILRKASLPARQGEVIAKLAISRFFVDGGDDIDALAAAMDKAPGLIAVGVVDAMARRWGSFCGGSSSISWASLTAASSTRRSPSPPS